MGLEVVDAEATAPLIALLRTVWLGERLTNINPATIKRRIMFPLMILQRPNFTPLRERCLGFQALSASSLELPRLPIRFISEYLILLIFNSWKRVKL
jgi:hypothetical protein